MKRKLAILAILIITVSLAGCSCGGGSVVGVWTRTVDESWITYDFREDGKIVETSSYTPTVRAEGQYTADGDTLTLAMRTIIDSEDGSRTDANVNWRFSYSVEKDRLVLVDLDDDEGTELVFLRQVEVDET
jgi:hypothetical protein